MFTPTTNMPPPSTETTYIINQNEKLQSDCNELREKISTMQTSYQSEIRELQTEKETFEEDLDKTDSSLRYLRNLQKTLSTLHQDSKLITDEYKQLYKNGLKAHKQTYNGFYNIRMTCYMILCSYILTLFTVLFSNTFSHVIIVCTTSSISVVGVCKYILNFNYKSLKCTEPISFEKSCASLVRKELEYKRGVDGLPGIIDLIDNI